MLDFKMAGLGFALLSGLVLAPPARAQAVLRFIPVPDNAILSSSVVGLAVEDAAGHRLGRIKDLVIASGRFDGYVLAVDGSPGPAPHDVVVSPGGLSVSYDGARKMWKAYINTTAEQLRAAPAFAYEGRWSRQ